MRFIGLYNDASQTINNLLARTMLVKCIMIKGDMREVLEVEDGWSGTEKRPGREESLCLRSCVTQACYELQMVPGEEEDGRGLLGVERGGRRTGMIKGRGTEVNRRGPDYGRLNYCS